MDFKEKKVYTLTELAASLRSVIEKNYTSSYWVKAEIAKLNFYPRSGHAYPELVEKTDNKITAQFRSTIWAGNFVPINKNFIEVTGEPLKEGIEILFRASVGFHAVYGLSLSILNIEPSFTLGVMALEKTKTIERLKEESVFDNNKLLDFPLLPKKIAVISVETSKGYHDYLNILEKFKSKYYIYNHLFPAILQGEQAVRTINAQLRKIRKNAYLFDAVALIRGGGGDIGLNCYNNYEMAKEIAAFPIPVITGIGHSTNETVTEMISYRNKITPTDVAYFFLGCFEAYTQRTEDAKNKLVSYTDKALSYENQRMKHLSKLLKGNSKVITDNNKNKLLNITKEISRAAPTLIESKKRNLKEFSKQISQTHYKTVINQRAQLESLRFLLKNHTLNRVRNNTDKIMMMESKIKLTDPENILKRGYSISLFNGKALKTTKQLSPGDSIITKLFEGRIESTITKIKNND